MRQLQLGEVADFINGLAFTPEDWGEQGTQIIRIQNLTDAAKPYNRTLREVPAKYTVLPGDLLVSWSASLGVFEWIGPEPALVNQHIFRVVPHEAVVDRRYLRYALELALAKMARHLHGSTMQHVNRAEFVGTRLAFPDIVEQRRIAAILDQVGDLRRKRRLAIEKLNALPQAVFQEMFGPERIRSERYPVHSLGELIGVSSGGALTQAQIIAGPFPVYGGNGINGYHSDFMVSKGTIIIGRVGVYCGAVHMTTSNAWVTDNALIVSIKSDAVQRTYLFAALTNAKLNQYAGRSAQPLISGGRIYPIKIPVPPLAEQERFALAVTAAASASKVSDEQSLLIEKFFGALQSQAFNGEL